VQIQRRRLDVPFPGCIVRAGHDDQQQERRHRDGGNRFGAPLCHRSQPGQHGGQPHVLGSLQRDHAAQHGQPEEQDGRQLIRPDQRCLEHVARHHPGEQHGDLHRHQDRREDRADMVQCPLAAAGKLHHDNEPTAPSSSPHAASPYFVFHSA
jgi:hypothetical protein